MFLIFKVSLLIAPKPTHAWTELPSPAEQQYFYLLKERKTLYTFMYYIEISVSFSVVCSPPSRQEFVKKIQILRDKFV